MNAGHEILTVEDLSVELGGRRRWLGADTPPIKVVSGVSLSLRKGEIFGLIGESGCGKTTLARAILGMQKQSSGSITLEGCPALSAYPRTARRERAAIQYVHQDAAAALDPWWSIGRTLREALIIARWRGAKRERIMRVLDDVGLPPETTARYPHELSGGQLRRVALARILLLEPRIIILDEPTAGLDMSIQATILNLLLQLRHRHELTYLFISHDLSVVERLCDRVAIMYLGKIVETAPPRRIFSAPRHPYTGALLGAVPRLDRADRQMERLAGEPPSPANLPPGCAFEPRCHHASKICTERSPELAAAADGHRIACWRWDEIAQEDPTDREGASRAVRARTDR